MQVLGAEGKARGEARISGDSIKHAVRFNDKSLRSNVVFRWEYRRGSTFFVVWNVSNLDQARPGEFSAFRDLRSGFGAAGTQVLMVKFNYWLGL